MAKHTGVHALTLEALRTFGVNGAMRPDVLDLIYEDLPGDHAGKTTALSNALFREKAKGNIVLINGRYWAKEFAPVVNMPKPVSNGTGKLEIPEYARGRTTKTVTIYTPPEQYDNVIGIVLHIQGQTFKMPVFDSVRICIGMEAPKFSVEQEMYANVDLVILYLKGGGKVEKRLLPKELVVIAPED